MVCDKSLQVRSTDKTKIEPESKPKEAIKKDSSAPVKKTTVKEEETVAPEKKPVEKEVPPKATKKPSAGNHLFFSESYLMLKKVGYLP